MDNIMQFPETFEEFAKSYGFKDSKEIYTNGSELIPVFRVEQWLEHARVERTCRATLCRDYPDWESVAYTCSECGEILVCFDFEQDLPKPIGYCPGCGAKVVEK